MGYDFVALPMETGGRQSEEAEQFLDRLVKYACGGRYPGYQNSLRPPIEF